MLLVRRFSQLSFLGCLLFPAAVRSNEPDLTSWQLTTPYPIPGYQYDPVEHDGHIYVLGGFSNPIAYDNVFVAFTNADGSLSQWVETSPLPEPCQAPGAATWQNHLYAALLTGNVYRAEFLSDGSLGSWIEESSAGYGRGGRMSMRAHRGYLYIFGGWDGGTTMYSEVYFAEILSDGSLGPWNTTTPMPQGRQHTSVHFWNDRAYIVGGISGGGGPVLDSVYSAPVQQDGTLGAWRQEASLPHTLWYHSSVLVDGRVFLFGGRTEYLSDARDEVYIGTIQTDGTIVSWNNAASLPGHNQAPGAVFVPENGVLYLIGGRDLTEGTTSEVWVTTSSVVQDQDNDTIPDPDDACPASNTVETIVINECDSGVDNLMFDDGCFMADAVADCRGPETNHGQFVRCVASLAGQWRKAGLITGRESAAIIRCAARRNAPRGESPSLTGPGHDPR